MSQGRSVIAAHPTSPAIDLALIQDCVQACFECAQACTVCADACIAEAARDTLLGCIRINQDCADICDTTGRIIARLSETDWTLVRAQLQACVLACRQCGDECRKHAPHHEHCRACAEACSACETACSAVLAATLTMESQVSVDTMAEQSFPASDAPAVNGSISSSPERRT